MAQEQTMIVRKTAFDALPVPGAVLVALVFGLVVSVILYALGKTLLRPFSSSQHSFVKTAKTKSRAQRKMYAPPNGYLLNKDNLYIFTQTWLPADSSKNLNSVIILAHGVGEHCGRYAGFAQRMCDALGVAVVALDHQGHGKSEGDRLFVVEFDDYLDDIRRVCQMAKERFPSLPLVMLGHSLGGLMAIRSVEKFPEYFSAAVFSAPALSVVASKTELQLAPYLSKYLPHLPTNKIDPNLLSHDPCIVDLYCNDPLCTTNGVSARLGCEILGAIDEALAFASEISMPMLVIRGGEDRVTLKPGVEQFLKAVSSSDKTFIEIEGLFHEIFNEDKGNAQQLVIEWLSQHLHTSQA
jgi:acylglycerol lipase